MRMDKRLHGTIVKNKDGREVPEDEFVVFEAWDDYFEPMLQAYSDQVRKDGAGPEQVAAVDTLLRRVLEYRDGEGDGVLDLKVHGTLVRDRDGMEADPSGYVIFRPHDNSFLSVLDVYRKAVVEDEDVDYLVEFDALVERIRLWRSQHPERCKVPDVQSGELR